jgi:mRNA interferase MazF
MKRGDVVLVDWPYSDRTGSKLRPAVVVQADFLNGLIDDTILVQITRTRHGIPGAEVVLDPAQETASGLSHPSFASCANLLTWPGAHRSDHRPIIRFRHATDRRLPQEGAGTAMTSPPWRFRRTAG